MILKEFDQQTIQLVPDEIFMESPLELSQYMIESWQLIYYDEGNCICAVGCFIGFLHHRQFG